MSWNACSASSRLPLLRGRPHEKETSKRGIRPIWRGSPPLPAQCMGPARERVRAQAEHTCCSRTISSPTPPGSSTQRVFPFSRWRWTCGRTGYVVKRVATVTRCEGTAGPTTFLHDSHRYICRQPGHDKPAGWLKPRGTGWNQPRDTAGVGTGLYRKAKPGPGETVMASQGEGRTRPVRHAMKARGASVRDVGKDTR